VTRLQLWRDIYYIANSTKRRREEGVGPITDFVHPTPELITRLRFDPSTWHQYLQRKFVDFPLGPDQFFVMGDNSPESSDARLWTEGATRSGGLPGGAYLERKLLIGKAVCVYWPHSWFRLPFVKWGVVPNVKDMRLVR
jgi:signal peptidase I